MNFLTLIKIHCWIKNFFAFLPVIFSEYTGEPKCILKWIISFLIFCMVLLFLFIFDDIIEEK